MTSVDPIALGGEFLAPPEMAKVQDTLLDSLIWICEYYGLGRSPEVLTAGLPRSGHITPSLGLNVLQNAGLTGGVIERHLAGLPAQLTPMVLLRKDHGGLVFLKRIGAGKSARYCVILPELGSQTAEISAEELDEIYAGAAILAKPRAKVDERAGKETSLGEGHWLWSTLWRYRRYYRSAILAAVLINVLTLAGTFFTMNVYDRIVPNQAYVSLWSLAIGVSIAMIFESLARIVRSYVLDVAGKKADLVMGSILFRQAMSVRMESKPASSGSFANQLREFESVRDFATSATLSTLTDLPFVLLFVGVIFFIGGTLGWIPALMLPLIAVLSLSVQIPLARTMKENLRETSLRQGLLIEAVEGLEALKAVGGEGQMQRRWERFSGLAAATSMKSRRLSTLATTLVGSLQQLQTVIMVVAGVYLIGDGKLTQGALIGSVMLASRATAPLGQFVGLALRYQQAQAAMGALNKLMAMPVDRDPKREYLPKPPAIGQLTLTQVGFTYPQTGMAPNPPVLRGVNMSIATGDRIAILGRIGSGKSTLLRVMARLYTPTDGQMFSDGVDVEQIDPADWRKFVGYVGQDARLFYGTLRENVMIGHPEATAEEFLRVLRLTGLDAVAAAHPSGVNMQLGENGQGLSGGQRQLVALARALLARPRVLLMDEPTSAMDAQTETAFIRHLMHATQGQTLVVVTHRPSVLALVNRIVVIEQGRVAMDGPKQKVLETLSANAGPAERAGE
ncbi:type I secretion system permease/ATPase [Lysobacter arvi]|uniref:Type I secretion system permease/ATPase n=1 Tax=Lysobacter arvi TaxID=3038776 RepID=A0ABU1C983_9GAMM|nr:type I secretion system permease/ATPase [Lysobacter arvi]MDR0181746.1 type I secretion system permease/ATPase [Lysobacter arvi]